jgi:hypothetical protein
MMVGPPFLGFLPRPVVDLNSMGWERLGGLNAAIARLPVLYE